jgi:hypothetical protein
VRSWLSKPVGVTLVVAVVLATALAVAASIVSVGRSGGGRALAANLWVDTEPGDGPCSYQSAPAGYDPAKACDTMREAYEAASDGGTVRVRPGDYPGQYFGGVRDPDTGDNTPVPHDEPVTFIGDRAKPANVTLYQLHFGGNGVTIDGFDVDTDGDYPGGSGGAALETGGGSFDITVKNSRIGNIDCQKGVMAGGNGNDPQPDTTRLVFDNVVFHDVTARTPGDCHNECIKVEAQAITIRNSTFSNCATMSISMGYGPHYGMDPYCCVTLVNNVIGHNTDDEGWHGGPNLAWFVGKVERIRMVNNTFERGVGMASEHIGPGPYSGVIANNVGGGWACLPGVTYAGNVGTACGDGDVAVSPHESTASVAAPFGWANPEEGDFSLTGDSPAIGVADPEHAPELDRAGNPRCDAPDAGALEYQGDC